ncbi:MAG: hypothetical protein AAFY71_03280 [Bacteroidota bacterium]
MYIHEIVKQVRDLHAPVIHHLDQFSSMSDRLTAFAHCLEHGYQQLLPAAASEISNYHPDYLGKSPEEIFAAKLPKAELFRCISCEYGFSQSIPDISFKEEDFAFERALDFLLEGKLAELEMMLATYPFLTSQSSLYGHQAKLLHYCGSNGVEIWRQVVPSNLMEGIKTLLKYGADPQAKMEVYGGEFDMLALYQTSAHPYEAGLKIDEELQQLLI